VPRTVKQSKDQRLRGGEVLILQRGLPSERGKFSGIESVSGYGWCNVSFLSCSVSRVDLVMDQIHFQALHIGSAVGMIDARFKRAAEGWPMEGWKWAAAIRSKAVDVVCLFGRSLPCAKRQPDSPSQQLLSNPSASARTLSACNFATNKPRHYRHRLRLLPALTPGVRHCSGSICSALSSHQRR